MDVKKLTLGDRVVVISGVLLFVFAFFKWFGISTSIGDFGYSGYHYFLWGVIPVILGVVMIVQIGLARFSDTKLPSLGSFTWGQVHMVLGGLAAALILLKTIIGDDVNGFGLDRKVGLFLGLLAALGLAGGGYLKMRDPADAGATPPTA
jgi:hypothetical protein